MKISEEIAETLRDEIIAGIYKPRERLIEEELSDRFLSAALPYGRPSNSWSQPAWSR